MTADHGMEWRRLDERAHAYARRRLGAGHTLARLCQPLLEATEAWVKVPSSWDAERPYDFRSGNVNPEWLPREQLLPLEPLIRHLRNPPPDGSSVVLFEDPYARASDATVIAGQYYTPVVTFEDEVLQIIDEPLLDDPLHFPVGEYPISGIATSTPAEMPKLVDGARITSEMLERLADRLVAIIIAAWDAESYILFSRELPHVGGETHP